MMSGFDPDRPELSRDIIEQVEIAIKCEGYVRRQLSQAREYKRQENRHIPDDIDYGRIPGLSIEARQSLKR